MTARLLLASLSLAGLAFAAPESTARSRSAASCSLAREAANPALPKITAAERNYILESLAVSVEGAILAAESPLYEYKAEQRLLILLKRELTRITIPLDGLSPAQQQYHNAGVKLLKSTIERMQQVDPAQYGAIFKELQMKAQELRDNAPEECIRLHDDQAAFLSIAAEVDLEQRFNSILHVLYSRRKGVEPNKAEGIRKLRAFAAHIRTLKH